MFRKPVAAVSYPSKALARIPEFLEVPDGWRVKEVGAAI